MNILVVTQVFPPSTGGSGRWLWELYRRLSQTHVSVVAGQAVGAEAFDAASALRIRRVPLDFAAAGVTSRRGWRGYATAFKALRGLIATERAGALHCGKALPEGLLALAVKWTTGVPYVCFVHGEELGLAATTREFKFLTMRVLANASTIVANSHHSKRLLTDEWHVPEDRIVVLHPGVDVGRFVVAPPSAEVRERFGWTGRRVILTVGALQKRKGQDMMIRALPAIRAACPDVLYAIAGEGWEREYLEGLARELGVADAVQFRGVATENELLLLMQQCDLFALPNRRVGWDFEGFGIALIEAQACGRPVIAGDSGGAPETLTADSGVLADCTAPEPLARAVIALLNDPTRRDAMGRAAREWVVRSFAWPRLANEAASRFGVPLAATDKVS